MTFYQTVASPAVGKVNKAVKAGRLDKMPCAVCGASKVEGHHANGYEGAAALDVTWLCKTHHLIAHGRRRLYSWEKPGRRRAYLATTGRRAYHGRQFLVADWASPTRLLWALEQMWSFLRTDEEREAFVETVRRLADKGEPA